MDIDPVSTTRLALQVSALRDGIRVRANLTTQSMRQGRLWRALLIFTPDFTGFPADHFRFLHYDHFSSPRPENLLANVTSSALISTIAVHATVGQKFDKLIQFDRLWSFPEKCSREVCETTTERLPLNQRDFEPCGTTLSVNMLSELRDF